MNNIETNGAIRINNMSIKAYMKQIWPVLGFYVIGDIATTVWALENGGFEYNPILAWGMGTFGYGALVMVKVAVLAILFAVYVANSKKHPFQWAISKGIFTVIGILLVCNNLIAILAL